MKEDITDLMQAQSLSEGDNERCSVGKCNGEKPSTNKKKRRKELKLNSAVILYPLIWLVFL
jgi:hypothetical protein